MSALVHKEFVLFLEVRGVYDGWSVGVTADRKMHNRWHRKVHPSRWAATQQFIDFFGGRFTGELPSKD